ncbi:MULTISPECIES: MFS transporter [Chelativorans]|jgi:MFS transporter (putative signal transducer)|uniref:Major facilitator superfamily MFS_1 n=1 Tax=Chelativorans sp. (strain BNC1) TaxID=266779 RepID=Q11LI4_CHESB|nr:MULTISPECIES: MFS transporter [Chelativorans]
MIRSAAVSQSATAVVLAVGGLYVAQSVIGGLTWAGLPAVLRDRGLGLDSVGLLSLIALPWALKFLWAPMVERFRLPPVGRNRSGVIVIFGGGLSIVGLGVVGLLGVASLGPVLACLTIIALAAATVDIACDGYAVESLPREQHGWANAAQVGGAYLGSAIGGGLFLVLVASYGWSLGVWAIAALLAILGVPFFLRWRTEATVERRSHIPSLASALRRPEIRRGLLAAALYVLAQKTAMMMVGPFLIDAGLDLATVGLVNSAGSMFVGLAAALVGGALVRAFGARTVLVIALGLQAAALFFFAARDLYPAIPTSALAAVAVASSSGIMALGFVALYAQFMHWSDPRQGGIDFTLFQSMDALVSMAGGIAAGYAAQHLGYSVFFAGAGLIAIATIPAIALVSGQGAVRDVAAFIPSGESP